MFRPICQRKWCISTMQTALFRPLTCLCTYSLTCKSNTRWQTAMLSSKVPRWNCSQACWKYRTLSKILCNTGKSETPGKKKSKPNLERLGNFHFMWSIVAYCLSRVDKSNQWLGNTPGQLQWDREKGMVGVKAHTLENELLSFKTKIPHDGKAVKWHCTVTLA